MGEAGTERCGEHTDRRHEQRGPVAHQTVAQAIETAQQCGATDRQQAKRYGLVQVQSQHHRQCRNRQYTAARPGQPHAQANQHAGDAAKQQWIHTGSPLGKDERRFVAAADGRGALNLQTEVRGVGRPRGQ